MAEFGDGIDKGQGVWIVFDVKNETPVDFDDIQRHPPQVIQRRVSRSEIVHGDLHSDVVDSVQNIDDFIDVIDRQTFGHFENQFLAGIR
jgi:hypothetical protein